MGAVCALNPNYELVLQKRGMKLETLPPVLPLSTQEPRVVFAYLNARKQRHTKHTERHLFLFLVYSGNLVSSQKKQTAHINEFNQH